MLNPMQKFRHSEDLPPVPQRRNGRDEESGKKRDPSPSAELRMTREYSHTALILKINVWFLFFLMGTLWAAAPALGDEESSSPLSAFSGTAEDEAPDATTLQAMIPQAMALAGKASQGATSRDAALQAMIPQVMALTQTEAKESAAEETSPGVDSAVQMAQQEIRDPFAAPVEPEIPEEVQPVAGGPVQPAGPPVVVELQGIGFGSQDAYAIIGGEVFYTGDEKNGIKLLEVRRREVDILANGGKMTVPLFPGGDLQKAKDRAEKKSTVKDAAPDQKSKIPGSHSKREQTPL